MKKQHFAREGRHFQGFRYFSLDLLFWSLLACFWSLLGCFLGPLGPPGATLGPFATTLARSLGAFWRLWGDFGGALGPRMRPRPPQRPARPSKQPPQDLPRAASGEPRDLRGVQKSGHKRSKKKSGCCAAGASNIDVMSKIHCVRDVQFSRETARAKFNFQ